MTLRYYPGLSVNMPTLINGLWKQQLGPIELMIYTLNSKTPGYRALFYQTVFYIR